MVENAEYDSHPFTGGDAQPLHEPPEGGGGPSKSASALVPWTITKNQTVLYSLGTQLRYHCKLGYNAEGFSKTVCVGEGRWYGPRMTCARMTSLHIYILNL